MEGFVGGLIVGAVVGLLVGWNLVPQPNWVRELFGLKPKL